MTKVFVKKGELSLVNGGYLVTGKDETPVSNVEFVAAQKRAEYIVAFADAAKGKDFKGKAADSLDAVKAEVLAKLAAKDKKYVNAGSKPKGEMQEKLAKEALAFIKFDEKSTNAEKVNQFLQEFNIINEFEEFGLFFEQDVTKLNRIYAMDEIVASVEAVIDLV
jgi:hypothetical protein